MPARHALTYAQIAVPIHDLPCDTTALDAAACIARQHGARLDVIQIVALPIPMGDTWALMPNPAFTQMYGRIRASAGECGSAIRHKLATLDVPGELRAMEAMYVEPAHLAAISARGSDITVLARPFRAPRDGSTVHACFAAVLLDSARPVLVVPAEQATGDLVRAIVAWRETRECARALRDALPMLARCERVDLLLVDPKPTLIETAEQAGTSAVRFLASHGIGAHRIVVASEGRSVGVTILEEASRRDAQLIVAGGYGHSRIREWAIGGTTRHLFHEATVPILFAH